MKCKRLLSAILAVLMIASCIPTGIAFATARKGATSDNPLSVGFNRNYTFTWTADDYYDSDFWAEVDLPSKGILQFNGSKLMDASGEEEWVYFRLYRDSDTINPIWETSSSAYQISEEYNINIPLEAGTYLFKIEGVSVYREGETRELQYRFNHTPAKDYETEPNNNVNLACALSFETRKYGYQTLDDDVYKIVVNKDTPARIKVGNLEAIDENGSVTVKFPGGSSDYIANSTYGSTKSGDYHYKDVLLKKGTNVITVTSANSGAKYWIEVSKDISVGRPKIASIEKVDGYEIEIKWDEVAGATKYEVYYKEGKGKWESYETYSNKYSIFTSKFDKSHQFKVRAFIEVGEYGSEVRVNGDWSKVRAINPTPTNVKLSATEYTYNGQSKKPTVKVKDVNGKTLKKNTDYKVTYAKGRKNVGKYKVTITFKGDYTGKVVKYFTINPKKTSVSKVTAGKKSLKIKIKKQTSQTSGYQIQYSTSKKFKSKKTVTINKNKTTSKTIKKLKAKKTYYVRVRTFKIVNGTKYYSAWSSAKKKKTK